MLRGLTKTLFRASTRFPRTARFFAEEAPAISKGNQAAGSAALSKYVNGELVTRTQLTLKKKEDIESFVLSIIKDYFRTTNKTGLKAESSLADHGLDSLDSIEISMRIEEELGYVISAETLPVLTKVKHFVNYISQVEAFKEKHGKAPLA